MYSRNCPTCNCEILSKNKNSLNKLCRSCASKIKGRTREYFSLVRICGSCNNEINYASYESAKIAHNKNKKCSKCSSSETFKKMHRDASEGKRKYPFANKKHSDEVKNKISNKVKLAFKKGILNTSGINNGMHNKSYPNKNKGKTYLEIYGTERSAALKLQLSNRTSGKNNPMYGKEIPIGSGNGWSGWYDGWYFRSIMELSFMIYVIERFNFKWLPGEKIKIKYCTVDNIDRTYSPDFILNCKYMIEIKPKKLFELRSVIEKKNAAIEYCKINNLKYKLINPVRLLNNYELIKLIELGKVKLLDRYMKKLNKI